MARYEISGGARTNYRGSKEDWKPTQKFIEDWHNKHESELPKCYIRLRDVNYATDPKIDGVRTAHYEIETFFGMLQYSNMGGGVVFARENPNPWIGQECLAVDMTLPYSWFNPETEGVEPGYIQIRLAAPGIGLHSAETLVRLAHELEYEYNHMIDTEYKGSRNELTVRNEDAEFSVTITPHSFLANENAQS